MVVVSADRQAHVTILHDARHDTCLRQVRKRRVSAAARRTAAAFACRQLPPWQAISPEQMMAARMSGTRPALAYVWVIWPQARRIAAPAALGVFLSAVNDTSLVRSIDVFDVFDVLGVLGVSGAAMAVVASTDRRPYHVEAYLPAALLCLSVHMGAAPHGVLN